MAFSQVFTIQRVALIGGVSQSVIPVRICRTVTIFSLASVDVSLYSTDGDDDSILPIAAGWNQPIDLNTGQLYDTLVVAFWLKCSLDATVILLWS